MRRLLIGLVILRYLEVAELNEGLGRKEEALRCAERAEDIDRACLGVDHEGYEATRKFSDRLRVEIAKSDGL